MVFKFALATFLIATALTALIAVPVIVLQISAGVAGVALLTNN